jgi:hypothetical protein
VTLTWEYSERNAGLGSQLRSTRRVAGGRAGSRSIHEGTGTRGGVQAVINLHAYPRNGVRRTSPHGSPPVPGPSTAHSQTRHTTVLWPGCAHWHQGDALPTPALTPGCTCRTTPPWLAPRRPRRRPAGAVAAAPRPLTSAAKGGPLGSLLRTGPQAQQSPAAR